MLLRRPARALALTIVLALALPIAAHAGSFSRAVFPDTAGVSLSFAVDSIGPGESFAMPCTLRVSKGGVPIDSFVFTPTIQNPDPGGGGPTYPLCGPTPNELYSPPRCDDHGCSHTSWATPWAPGVVAPHCYQIHPQVVTASDCECGDKVVVEWWRYGHDAVDFRLGGYGDAVCVVPGSDPDVIAYDGFDYNPTGGAVSTYPPGGHGWKDMWTGAQTVIATGMQFVPTPYVRLQVTGGALQSSTAAGLRTIALPEPLGEKDGTVWFSMIAKQTSGAVGGTWGGLTLPCSGLNSLLFFGKPFGQANWGLDSGTNGSIVTTTTPATQQAFLVMRVVFHEGADDDVTLWLNPTPGKTAPINYTDMKDMPGFGDFHGVQQVSMASNTGMLLDEVRVGSTYLSVAPAGKLPWNAYIHYDRGQSDLSVDPLGRMMVKNITTSGLDGFQVAQGNTGGAGQHLHFDPDSNTVKPGYWIQIDDRSNGVNGSYDGSLVNAVLQDIGSNQAQLDVTMPSQLATDYTVNVFKGGAPVASLTGQSGLGITLGPVATAAAAKLPGRLLGAGSPIGGLDVTLSRKPAGRVGLQFADSNTIHVGATTVVGDRIDVIGTNPGGSLTIEEVELSVLAKNMDLMTIDKEDLTLDGLSVAGTDDAVLTPVDGYGPSSRSAVHVGHSYFGGPFGLKASKVAGRTGLSLDLDHVKPVASGAEMRFRAKGVRNALPDQPLGEAWWSPDQGDLDLSADYSDVGATGLLVEVLSGGVPVSSTVVPGTGAAALVGGGADLVGVKRVSGGPLDFQLSTTVPVTPTGGAPVFGDRVRVSAAGAAAASKAPIANAVDEDVTDLEMVAMAMDSFVVYTDTPAPTTGVPNAPAPFAPRLEFTRVRSNPTTHGLRVTLSLPTSQRAEVDVLDVQGRRMQSVTLTEGPGLQAIDLDPGDRLPAGVYLVRAQQGGRSAVARVVVIR